jgi:hypothetical protein
MSFDISSVRKVGKPVKMEVDFKSNELSVDFQLEGESSPIRVTAQFRSVEPDWVEITQVQSSRAWIAALANEFIPASQKRFRVPNGTLALLA